MKRLMIVCAVAAVMTGCSSMNTKHASNEPLPSPTPAVTKDQTVAAQGKVENAPTIDIPAWYIKAPASTEDYVYITGTAVSSDLSMSRTKALLDAQVQLADKINGLVNALTKQTRKDDSGTVGTDRTTQTVKKVIMDTALTGYHLEDSKVMAENRGYRTFVLVRYPLGDSNRMLKDKLQRERQDKDDEATAVDELDKELDSRRKKPAPVVDKTSSAPVSTPIAIANTVKPLDVDNAEYKARRDAALARGATIEQITVR